MNEGARRLETGKLPVDLLSSIVLGKRGRLRSEVVLHSSIGEDSCAVDPSGMMVVMSTDPITGANEDIGWLSVHVSCNDLAANGAEPLGILATVLLPPGSDAAVLDRIMKGIDEAARQAGIELLGGHTEVTAAVTQPLVSATAVGLAQRDRLITKAGASAGDVLILTKGAGLEATAILATDFADVLSPIVGRAVVERARGFRNEISVVRDGLIAAGNGARAMHDATEGGILGAAYEMAEAASRNSMERVGCVIRAEDVPVRPETAAICKVAGVDPLMIVSSGAMLVAARPGDAPAIVSSLRGAGIEASVIGEFTAGPGAMEPPGADHLWRARANLEELRARSKGGQAPGDRG